MNDDRLLGRQLLELRLLVWGQRSLRLVLRAAWLGSGLVLLAWGLNSLLGWFQDAHTWLWMGGVAALALIVTAFISFPLARQFTWRLDRRLGLFEQLSTAAQVARQGESGPIAAELLQDALALSQRTKRRILARGWHLARDVVSTLIVALLAYGVYQAYFASPFPRTLPLARAMPALVPLGVDPQAGDIFPDGNMAMPPEQADQGEEPKGEHSPAEDSTGDKIDLTEEDIRQLLAALKSWGTALSQQAATYEDAQGLLSRKPDPAARSVESLSDKLGKLSPELKEFLAEAMDEASVYLQTTNLQMLHNDILDASNAVLSVKDVSADQDDVKLLLAKEKMDQVAQDIRDLAGGDVSGMGDQTSADKNAPAGEAGGGAGLDPGSRETSPPEPFSRIEDQGGEIELDVLGEAEQAMLTPGDLADGDLLSGAFDSTGLPEAGMLSGDEFYTLYIIPYMYPWQWRDVVSTYFQEYR